MNIFYLDKDIIKCAQDHSDKHVVKMIIELAQLASTAKRLTEGIHYSSKNGDTINRFFFDKQTNPKNWYLLKDADDYVLESDGNNSIITLQSQNNKCYSVTHKNHPCAIWTRANLMQYLYTVELGLELCKEYSNRYHGKTHKTQAVLQWLKNNPPKLPCTKWVQPPQAMPDEFKAECSVEAYRNYYKGAKRHLAVWNHSKKPNWYV